MADEMRDFLRVLARAESWSGTKHWARAVPLWEQVVAANPVTGNYWARLAEARSGLGEHAAAAQAYQQVLRLGAWRPVVSDASEVEGAPYLIPGEVAYQIACCHARAGDAEQAIAALRDALDRGFRDVDRARAADDWADLRTDPRVADLLGIPGEDVSRDDGWRADLDFLGREIPRRAWAPFAEISEADFGERLAALRAQVADSSDAQLIMGIARLLRHLGDGHAFVRPPADDEALGARLPLDFFDFAEGVHIVAAAPEYRRLLGARLESVGGHDLTQVAAVLDTVISRDNDQQVRLMTPRWLRAAAELHALGLTAAPGAAMLGVVLPDGSREQAEVTAVSFPGWPGYSYPADWITLPDTVPGPLPLHLRHRELPYWFEYLPEADLVYFQFNGVRDHPGEPFAAFCDRLFAFADARRPGRLVIDLRWNGGGNTYLSGALLAHLARSPLAARRGGLYVIIGRGTFSAAQNTATMLEERTAAIFVGEPTGSRPNFIGETIPFELPHTRVIVNVADLYWQMSWPTDHRTWIAPQLYVPVTFAAFRANADPALDAILASTEQLPGT